MQTGIRNAISPSLLGNMVEEIVNKTILYQHEKASDVIPLGSGLPGGI